MKHRDPVRVALLTVITFGLYTLFWFYNTKNELNEKMNIKTIPTLWWFIVPFGSYWWMWKYSEALENMTSNKIKRNDTFLLYALTTVAVGITSRFDVNNVIFKTTFTFAIVAIVVLISMLIFSIFPFVMQKKFNDLPNPE